MLSVIRPYSVEWLNEQLIGMNLEGSGLCLILKYYLGIWLDGLMKIMNLSMDNKRISPD
jgi:hypothetical protein